MISLFLIFPRRSVSCRVIYYSSVFLAYLFLGREFGVSGRKPHANARARVLHGIFYSIPLPDSSSPDVGRLLISGGREATAASLSLSLSLIHSIYSIKSIYSEGESLPRKFARRARRAHRSRFARERTLLESIRFLSFSLFPSFFLSFSSPRQFPSRSPISREDKGEIISAHRQSSEARSRVSYLAQN